VILGPFAHQERLFLARACQSRRAVFIVSTMQGGGMFIWLFHRISGVILIVLFSIKILTSFFLFTKDKKPDWALSLHRHPVLDILILILFTFHSLYGLRTVAIDLGYRKEKQLFWVANVAATVISVALISLYVGSQ
jgi:succinate dehydrogenase/fumarate reductase cytochrome b subunit